MNKSEKSRKFEVFHTFMDIQGLDGKPFWKNPPAPTILFESTRGERRAFELAEVCYPNFSDGRSYSRYDSMPQTVLRDRFHKEYESDVEVDLILYYDQCPLPANDTWIDRFRASVNSLMNNGGFANVFVFDVRNRSVEFDFSYKSDAA